MPFMFNPFKFQIASRILDQVQKISSDIPFTTQDIYNSLTLPPDFSMGQAALPCFIFAKQTKQNPSLLAKTLAQMSQEHMALHPEQGLISKVEALGPYLNFHCNFEVLLAQVVNELSGSTFFKKDLLEPQEKEKIIVEYSQPNTHKAVHVGHLRCLVLGDSLCQLLENVGHTVVRATFPGDLGTHVAKVISYLSEGASPQFKDQGLHGDDLIQARAQWLGEMYCAADKDFQVKKGTNLEPALKEGITNAIDQIAKGEGPLYDLWQKTRQWSLDYLKLIYSWLNVRFDIWYYESFCEAPSKKLVQKLYDDGFFVKDKGAIGIDLSPWKLGFVLYLKSDGHGLYITKDLHLLLEKLSDTTITKSIYVVDVRQKLHFAQLFKTAELMGIPQAKNSLHLPFETVNAEDGTPFSSRVKNGLDLSELKVAMEQKVTSDYLSRYKETWSQEDIQRTARDVTIAALKYGLLKVDNNTQIQFSLSDWLKLDGDTGAYLEYVHARSSSILDKFQWSTQDLPTSFLITTLEEKELIFSIFRYHEHLLLAAQSLRPSVMAHYLQDLCKTFNRFYEQCPIKGASPDVRASRLALVDALRQILAQGLALLGIPAVPRI